MELKTMSLVHFKVLLILITSIIVIVILSKVWITKDNPGNEIAEEVIAHEIELNLE